ncbi:A24 family peptidase [Rhizobium paknamense]|uniref:Prepilin peptidase CpaA n=1 Tax=Rhizobium paknamense TaxID=1206817 RepID=A0ABU0IB29_9HYPH|nr:prepilin peptidase [Rhizobium paknamense]MDQ0455428.1 prepilin peptidase CpaA [Rhizobium paknamense]
MAATLILLIFPLCLLAAAITDLVAMKIPNSLVLFLLAGFFLAALLSGMSPVTFAFSLLAGFVVLGVCFLLFAVRAMGGGDAKLLAAAAPWFGWNAALLGFLLHVAVCGGVLTLVLLLLRSQSRRLSGLGWRLPHSLFHAEKIPYGIAIAAGGLLSLSKITVLPPLFL